MDYRALLAAPLAALMLGVGAAELRLPQDWQPVIHAVPVSPRLSSRSGGYEIGLDPRDQAAGPRSLTVKSVGTLNEDYPNMGLAQQVAHGYASQRVRLTGQVRSEGVREWAGLFMGPGDASLLSGPAHAMTAMPMGVAAQAPDGDWQDVSVVVQVPAEADDLVLGVALVGQGQVWARRLHFEVVGPDVPLTGTTLGFDVAKAREASLHGRKVLLALPPSELVNAALD